MADIKRHAEAHWSGDLRSGSGKISTSSGTLHEAAYSVPSRFESGKGTNPEELLAAERVALNLLQRMSFAARDSFLALPGWQEGLARISGFLQKFV